MTMDELVSPLIADNAVLAEFWRYWARKRGHRAMARWCDIDPCEIPRLLPHLQIVEWVMPSGRFRYRLTGTAIVEAYGRDLTGYYVDEVIPAPRRAVAEGHYRLVYDTRRPIFVTNQYTTTKLVDIVASRIILPLSLDDERVGRLIMAQTFRFGQIRTIGGLGGDAKIASEPGQVSFLEE